MSGLHNHRDTEAQRDPCTERVIECGIEVHRALGPGLLESAYEECLCYEFSMRGMEFKRQVPLPVRYKSIKIESIYRMDIVVEGRLIVEVKTVDRILPVHEAQLLTYMKLSAIGTGLIMNFNVAILKDGLKRMVL